MSKWNKVSDMKRLSRMVMPLDAIEGLPDNHIISVTERTIEIDESELVQNNVSTDTYTLELDAEWDDITPVVIFSNSQGDYQVAYENGPTKIPAAVMAVVGSVDVSVFGLDSTGAVRVVTKAAPNTMTVVESGKFVGEVSEDDISLLGQLLAAAEAANEAAANANATIIKSAVATTLDPGEPATANIADNILTIGVPKGEKGDKGDQGDPGQDGQNGADGADGVTPFTQATVTTLDPGTQATVTIEEDTLKLGIPKGEKGDKGDKGDPGTTPTVVAAEGSDLSVSTDEGTVTIDDSALRARISELEQQTQNVVTGTSTGLVSHGEDAFPQKPREVRIKGKTWANRWLSINGSLNGVTVSTDDTGLITISGTPTNNVELFSEAMHTIKPNTSYSYRLTNIVSDNVDNASFALNYGTSNNSHFGKTTTGTFVSSNFGDDSTVRCEFYIGTSSSLIGKPFNWSGRVMLVDGTEAPDCFTPCASITSVETGNLVTAGKNLLPVAPQQSDTVNGDGSYTLNGTATVDIYKYKESDTGFKLPPGTYTVSGGIADKVNVTIVKDDRWLMESSSKSNSITTTTPGDCYFYLRVNNGTTLNNVTVYPQLELGSTATPYEPPSITQTPLPEVELRSLPNGTCDELVIKEDGTCEVERKTVQVTFDGSEDERINGPFATGEYFFFDTEPSMNLPVYSGATSFSDTTMVSDTLPIGNFNASHSSCIGAYTANDSTFIRFGIAGVSTVDELRSWLQSHPTTIVYTILTPTTEPQSPVTLPALPAPTFNQYHDADVPSDTSTQYVRDINLVLANLESVQAALLGGE